MIVLPETSTLLLPFKRTRDHLQPLRVGVVLDRTEPSPWVDALLSFLRQLPGIEVRPLALSGRRLAASKQLPWLTDRLYSISRARFDPFGDITGDGTESATLEALD